MKEIARELIRIADSFVNPLNGLKKQAAIRLVNKLIPKTRGFYSDNSWAPVNAIFKEFNKFGLDWTMTKAEYRRFNPYTKMDDAKVWSFEISFLNDRGRETTLYGNVTASGGGPKSTMDDPLGSYDVSAYVS